MSQLADDLTWQFGRGFSQLEERRLKSANGSESGPSIEKIGSKPS